MDNRDVTVEKLTVHVPSLEEISAVLQSGLEKNFASVRVSVVDCPDLTQKPYSLAAPGLCGNPRIADVGGPPYLIPMVQRDKVYDIRNVSSLVELPGAFMIGAGAGPFQTIGVNSEMVCNIKLSQPDENRAPNNKTHYFKVNPKDSSSIIEDPVRSCEFGLLGNLLCSEGKPGKVLEVIASQRTGPENYMECIREVLHREYDTKPVALGGTFLVEKGKVTIHVMPDFSCVPLNSDDEVDDWLKFYEVTAPLVFVGELVSHDPGLDLRVEHFHGYSEGGDGGHYHYDTTPAEVMYRGYFSIAEVLYRIDRPIESHHIGRN